MIASLKVISLASCVTQLGVNVMIIGGSETFARLQMSVNRKKSFAIVRTVHLHYFSSCRSVHHEKKFLTAQMLPGLYLCLSTMFQLDLNGILTEIGVAESSALPRNPLRKQIQSSFFCGT